MALLWIIAALGCYASMWHRPADEGLGRFACGMACANWGLAIDAGLPFDDMWAACRFAAVVGGLHALDLSRAVSKSRRGAV